MKCQYCDKEYKGLQGLHRHVNSQHEGVADYYAAFHPRFDRFDHSPIIYKDKKYFYQFFNSQENRDLYYNLPPSDDIRRTLNHEFKSNPQTQSLTTFPSSSYFLMTNLFSCDIIRHQFGSVKAFCEKQELQQYYTDRLPQDFWIDSQEELDMEVLIDNREQKPFSFKNGHVQKLSIGDYTACDHNFSKIAVDRKNPADFYQSFGKDHERLFYNIKVARDLGYKLYFVVEGGHDEFVAFCQTLRRGTHLAFTYKNARQALSRFPETCNIIFCKDREQAQTVTRKILFYGERLWKCDIQYFI